MNSVKFKKFMYTNNLIKIINNSLISLPTPLNINLLWNFGSLLGMFLMIQIFTGFFLSMHYCPNINYAFDSIINIMKNINNGWLFRIMHMNGASMYFIIIYLHISRNLYYCTYINYQVWLIGVLILFLSMASAFMGYVLPWGQMSFWGATVITNLISAIPFIGQDIVEWIWGGFSINNATLNRFFSLHFILPLIILIMVNLHLFFLHIKGSNNPLGMNNNIYKISFYPYFIIKDLLIYFVILLIYMLILLQNSYLLGDPDNFILANSLNTPQHIKPEWYFLFAYSILRAIPNKLGGVIMLILSILILSILPLMSDFKFKSLKFYPINQILFWIFINIFILLTWLGGQFIEHPYILLNNIFTNTYFIYYFLNYYIMKFWDKFMF